MPGKATSSESRASKTRVMIYIDGSNLYHVLTENCDRHDLVFGKFVDKLVGDRTLVRTYYYNIRQNPSVNAQSSADQDRFLQTLSETPFFEVRLGVHRRHRDTVVEKGVDVMLATDLVVGAFRDLYDMAIVVSGDGDFFPAMQVAKDQGKHVEVAAFDSNLSPEARRVADTSLIFTKSYFTGLWTDRRRTRKPSDETTSAPEQDGRRTRKPSDDTTSQPEQDRRRRRGGSSRSRSSSSAEVPETRPTDTRPAETRKPEPEVAPATTNGARSPEKADDGGSRGTRRPRRRRLVSVTGASGPPQADAAAEPSEPSEPSKPKEKTPSSDSDDGSRRVGWFRRRRTRRASPSSDSGE